jgi:hypothetical protein
VSVESFDALRLDALCKCHRLGILCLANGIDLRDDIKFEVFILADIVGEDKASFGINVFGEALPLSAVGTGDFLERASALQGESIVVHHDMCSVCSLQFLHFAVSKCKLPKLQTAAGEN